MFPITFGFAKSEVQILSVPISDPFISRLNLYLWLEITTSLCDPQASGPAGKNSRENGPDNKKHEICSVPKEKNTKECFENLEDGEIW